MNGTTLSAADALGTLFCDVAEGRRNLGEVLEAVAQWQDDMAAREAAIRSLVRNPSTDAMVLRARGMYLASLALATRLETIVTGRALPSPVKLPR